MSWRRENQKSIILSHINMRINTHISNEYLFRAKSNTAKKKRPQSNSWIEVNQTTGDLKCVNTLFVRLNEKKHAYKHKHRHWQEHSHTVNKRSTSCSRIAQLATLFYQSKWCVLFLHNCFPGPFHCCRLKFICYLALFNLAFELYAHKFHVFVSHGP